MGQLLARQAEAFAKDEDMETRFGRTCDGLPHDIINFLHDPLACAIALDWNKGVEIRELPVKSEIIDGSLYQTVDSSGKATRVVTTAKTARSSANSGSARLRAAKPTCTCEALSERSVTAGEMPQDDHHFPWNCCRECLPRGFLQMPKLRTGAHRRRAKLAKTICSVDQR